MRTVKIVLKACFCLLLAWVLVLFTMGPVNTALKTYAGIALPFGLLILPLAVVIFLVF